MELFRALATLAEPPCAESQRLATLLELGASPTATEYTDLFLFQLYPYASVYVGADGMLGGEARDRIAGFWRALGETPPAEPDHLTVLLSLYAHLVELEENETQATRRSSIRQARTAFLWEHLLSWLPIYLSKLIEIASPPYASWGRILREALAREAGECPMRRVPAHLREAPQLPHPQLDGTESFLAGLLTPVRSGMILARSDLGRAARSLGLALRAGERRLALKTLLSQDPAGTVDWLCRESANWIKRHDENRELLGEIAVFWRARVGRTQRLLNELRDEKGAPRAENVREVSAADAIG